MIQEIEFIQEDTLYNVFLIIGKKRNFCISINSDNFVKNSEDTRKSFYEGTFGALSICAQF